MDEGLPIGYPVLQSGVPVLARDGSQVGVVQHVIAAEEEDIFHGVVISTPHSGARFVPAEQIAALHERGVDLRIDGIDVGALPAPEHGAPVYTEDPAESKWGYWAHKLGHRSDWRRES